MAPPPGAVTVLTARDVEVLVVGGETLTVEFKSERGASINDREIIEAVVCLANTDGGTLLIGVEDDGTISGAQGRHEGGNTDPRRVEVLIANRTNPSAPTAVSVVDMSGVQVLVIEVASLGRTVATSDGRYLRRVIGGDGRPACVPI